MSDQAASTAPSPSPSTPTPWFFSRWPLYAKAKAIRSAGYLASWRKTSIPADQYFYVDSTLGASPVRDAIGVAVYRPTTPADGERAGKKKALVNFHGGGFTFGQATGDARWCRTICDELGMVVFSVDYRMAPEYPFPIPVEDCVDAILAIICRADELGIDAANITLGGSSAGGNLALASWILCRSPTSATWSYPILIPEGTIKGLVLFYPVLDWSIPRTQKLAALPPDYPVLPDFLEELFDVGYIYPPRTREERRDARLSPGLMDEALLRVCPPVHLVVCQQDMLAEEARVLGRRLEGLGEGRAGVREVEGEAHGWDRRPGGEAKSSVVEEYKEAVESIRRWICK